MSRYNFLEAEGKQVFKIVAGINADVFRLPEFLSGEEEMHFLESGAQSCETRGGVPAVFACSACVRPLAAQMVKQAGTLLRRAVVSKGQLRGWHTLAQLLPEVIDLHGQPATVDTPDLVGMQAFGGGAQRQILHQVDHVGGQWIAGRGRMQTDQRCPGGGPAAYQHLVA